MRKITIDIRINYEHKNTISLYKNIDEYNLIMSFDNLNSYLEFLNNSYVKIDEVIIDQVLTEDIKNYLIFFISKRKEKLKETTPIYKIENEKDLDILSKFNEKIILNLKELSFEEIIKIITSSKIKSNFYFMDKYSIDNETISLKDILNMYENIFKIANEINNKAESPLEKYYEIYKFLKSHIYKEELNGESPNKSRSLNQILNNDSIVCVGFSKYFLAISEILKLKSEEVYWENKNKNLSGHSSIIIYLNDLKYKLKGIYAIDSAWDCKKNLHDENYQQNISHFLTPINIEILEKNKENLINPRSNLYFSLINLINIQKELKKNKDSEIIKWINYSINQKISKIYDNLNIENYSKSIYENNKNIKNMSNNLIPLEILESLTAEDNCFITTSFNFRALKTKEKLLYLLANDNNFKR